MFSQMSGKKENDSALGWAERYRIAVGVAEALDYLHGGGGSVQPVIHRDVKSSNILLSDDFDPQVLHAVLLFLNCFRNILFSCSQFARLDVSVG